MMRARPLAIGICLGVASTAACATSALEHHVTVRTTEDAGAAVARHTALSWNPDTLYQAALLHATPGRPTYDPDRAAELLSAFLGRFPADPRRRDASDRLALVNEVRLLRAELRALKEIDLARPPR